MLWLLLGAVVAGGFTYLARAGNAELGAGQQQAPSGSNLDRDDRDDREKQDERDRRRPDHVVSSGPKNVVWGGFPIDSTPVLTMRSGETVRIDTLSQSGATGTISPTAFFAQFGVPATEVLPDLEAFWKTIPNGETPMRVLAGRLGTARARRDRADVSAAPSPR